MASAQLTRELPLVEDQMESLGGILTDSDFLRLRNGEDDRAPGLRSSDVEVISCDEETGVLLIRRGDGGTLVSYNLRNAANSIPLSTPFEILARTSHSEAATLEPYEVAILRTD